MTEAMETMAQEQGFADRYQGAPPRVPAAVVAWLAGAAPGAVGRWNGRTLDAQRFCRDRGLLPDWP
jgi:hypothetical protein